MLTHFDRSDFALGWQSVSTNILLVTTDDETHRRPLLESQGYLVKAASAAEAEQELEGCDFDLALVPTELEVDSVLEFCRKLKSTNPQLRVAVIAQRAEYVPADSCIDVVIREQHSPGRFLAAVKKLLDVSLPGGQSFTAADGK